MPPPRVRSATAHARLECLCHRPGRACASHAEPANARADQRADQPAGTSVTVAHGGRHRGADAHLRARPRRRTDRGGHAARGLLAWRDETLRNDSLLLAANDLPSLNDDQVYTAWLSGPAGDLFLGTLGTQDTGAQSHTHSLTFAAPDHANLLAGFDHVAVGRTSRAAAEAAPPTTPVLAGALPAQALVHVRHVLVGIGSTPAGVGFALGLRQETDKVLQHAQFLQDAVDEGNLANVHFHAEHLVNIIEGSQGEHFGDLDGNGRIDNPGDGFGLLEGGDQPGYVKGMQDHAALAAAAPDATDAIKVHAGHVQIAGDNTRQRLSQIRDRALQIATVRRAADAREDVQRVLALAQQTIVGVDLNGDEIVSPVPGEGGVLTAYQHAQLMAGIPLERPLSAGAAAQPTLIPAVAPTLVPTLQATVQPTVQAVVQAVHIGDDAFAPSAISVPVGTTLVWSRSGVHPHTVTADDGSFDSGVLRGPQTFERTFTSAGEFAYYCDIHGGPGGAGMSARVIVTR